MLVNCLFCFTEHFFAVTDNHSLDYVREGLLKLWGTKLLLHGGACTVLTAVPVFLIGGSGETADTDTLFTGASLLDVSVGGYVITAVAAFMVGVFITALLIKRQKRTTANTKREKKEKSRCQDRKLSFTKSQ